MSSTNVEDAQKQEHVEDTGKDQVDEDLPENDPMHVDRNEESSMPSPQQEVVITVFILGIFLFTNYFYLAC